MKTHQLLAVAAIAAATCVWNLYSQVPYRDFSALDTFFRGEMTRLNIPGLAACIADKDSIIWEGYYGYANVALGTPVTDSSIFKIASISKLITWTALMRLHEQGYFDLDDDINNYLPFSVRNPTHPDSPITFRMLMTHHSSISDNYTYLPWVDGDQAISLETFLESYLVPGGSRYAIPNFTPAAPGFAYRYSNVGAALGGYLVERLCTVWVTVTFDDYCRDSLFTRMNMTNTAWMYSNLDTTLVAHQYQNGNDLGFKTMFGVYPCGELKTTVRSLARFFIMQMNHGTIDGERVLDSVAVHRMLTVQDPADTVFWDGYYKQDWYLFGLGWQLCWFDGRYLWGHSGASPGATTMAFFSPTADIAAIVFVNQRYTNLYDSDLWLVKMMEAADVKGSSVPDEGVVPTTATLNQNYPNPFNPSTTIEYQLPKRAQVSLRVFNMLGQEVAVLVNEEQSAGYRSVNFNGAEFPSGVYLYRLQAGDFVATKKLVLLK